MVIATWFVFLINPFIGSIFVVLGLYKDRRNNVHYALMLATLFASFAYWFIPKHAMDLTRYFDQLYIYSNLPWNTFVESVLSKKILVIQELFFYFISKTNNYHLLPAIVIFIVYFIMFYMITDYANRNNVNSKNMMITFAFMICVLPFASLVSNVRNILAFSIFVFAAYREFEQEKKNLFTYTFYIVPIFIHISAVALFIIRLILPLYNINKKRRLLVSIGVIVSSFLVEKFAQYIQYLHLPNRVISAFFNKADSYINKTDTAYAIYLQNSLFMKLQKVYFVSMVAFFLIVLILINRNIKKNEQLRIKFRRSNNKMLSFYSLLCCTVLGTAPIIITVYMRFVFPAIILSFLVIMQKRKFIKFKLYRQIISISMLVGGIGGLLHQVIFMNKMIDIPQMFSSVITRSIFNMFSS